MRPTVLKAHSAKSRQKTARSSPRKPLHLAALPKLRGVSWWASLADPALPREEFIAAARARNEAMRCDPVWQRPEIGSR